MKPRTTHEKTIRKLVEELAKIKVNETMNGKVSITLLKKLF